MTLKLHQQVHLIVTTGTNLQLPLNLTAAGLFFHVPLNLATSALYMYVAESVVRQTNFTFVHVCCGVCGPTNQLQLCTCMLWSLYMYVAESVVQQTNFSYVHVCSGVCGLTNQLQLCTCMLWSLWSDKPLQLCTCMLWSLWSDKPTSALYMYVVESVVPQTIFSFVNVCLESVHVCGGVCGLTNHSSFVHVCCRVCGLTNQLQLCSCM